jgi:hypothetical protein
MAERAGRRTWPSHPALEELPVVKEPCNLFAQGREKVAHLDGTVPTQGERNDCQSGKGFAGISPE